MEFFFNLKILLTALHCALIINFKFLFFKNFMSFGIISWEILNLFSFSDELKKVKNLSLGPSKYSCKRL